ncbi:MAG: limonene-1,2-epoxide hydrolase [Sphingomonadales bacterium BRH_c3]|nr:MAG: limonene-1,2-epoxide hydrolase [Sphingomonadales bacterium BRH_c3]
MDRNDNVAIISKFIAAWSRLDADELVSFFADDGIYHNMPIGPVQGRDALRQFIRAFLAGWTETEWDILTIAASGDIVFAERLDRIIANGKAVNLPCCGVFELEGGKIKVWRDYFDMATYRAALEA